MNAPMVDPSSIGGNAVPDDAAPDDAVLETLSLGFPWATVDPFIVTVHHVDHYPAGDADMGPETTAGQRDRDADPSTPGWGMYYGNVVPGFPQHPHRGL